MEIPKLPVGDWGAQAIAWITANLAFLTNGFGSLVTALDLTFGWLLGLLPAPAFAILLAIVAWRSAGRAIAVFTAIGLLLIWDQGLWPATIETLALVLTATLISLVIGIPVGILIAENEIVGRLADPILSFLQTMPRFVYLIPAVIILGIDVAPAVLATITLAVVPPIRITATGLSAVDPRMIEAADAMGCSPLQLLFKVKLPLALPAIMLGVNQCIMMVLSMVVIASLIGAAGLGDQILQAIAVLDSGKGIIAGFAVFVLAVVLDRITRGFGSLLPQAARLRQAQ